MEGKQHEPQPAAGPAASPSEPGEHVIPPGVRSGAERPGPAQDLSTLLYSLVIRPWTSLAIVSPDEGERAWHLAQKLAEAARQSHYPALKAVNLLDLNAERAAGIAHAVNTVTALGERKRFVIAIANPAENPIALRVLTVCEVALLLLERGRSRIPDAQRTVELVGRNRLIGAVLCSD
jgi:hypothetical protein